VLVRVATAANLKGLGVGVVQLAVSPERQTFPCEKYQTFRLKFSPTRVPVLYPGIAQASPNLKKQLVALFVLEQAGKGEYEQEQSLFSGLIRLT
jgi:hypothetical protein